VHAAGVLFHLSTLVVVKIVRQRVAYCGLSNIEDTWNVWYYAM